MGSNLNHHFGRLFLSSFTTSYSNGLQWSPIVSPLGPENPDLIWNLQLQWTPMDTSMDHPYPHLKSSTPLDSNGLRLHSQLSTENLELILNLLLQWTRMGFNGPIIIILMKVRSDQIREAHWSPLELKILKEGLVESIKVGGVDGVGGVSTEILVRT